MSDYPQVTVSIGRNYGTSSEQYGRPMSYRRWIAYKSAVMETLMAAGTVIGSTFGRSVWRDEDSGLWTFEQSFTIYAADIPPERHWSIRRTLAALAAKYGQDSVAVTVADPSFISAAS